MKLKKFFIYNKSKIKEILVNILNVLVFLIIVFSVYSCGVVSGAYFEKSEEANKKELVNRKQVNNINNDFNYQIYSSLPSNPLVTSRFYSSDSLLDYDFYSDVYLNDDSIYFDYYVSITFGNFQSIYFPGNYRVSFTELNIDRSVLVSDEYLYCSLYCSGYDLPYFLEGSEALDWVFDLEFEFGFLTSSYDIYHYFTPPVILNIRELVLDDVWFDSYDDWINYFTSIASEDSFDSFGSYFYSSYNPFYIYNNIYNEGYDNGYLEGQPKNIFYFDLEKDSPYLLVFDDISYIRPDDYDENLLFKNNYLDLQYLRTLYSGQYSKFRIIFTDSIYSLKDLYLSLDNSSLYDYNILVNGKAYSINSSGTLNIPSSELLQVIEFDSLLLDSTRLVNSSPDFANGFNSGYENGYQNGYDEGVDEEETRYDELIIPAVKVEYEQIGFDKGYQKGKNDTLNDGSGVALFDAFTLIGKGFEAWNPILNIQVLPGMSLGVFIAIPIIIAVVIIVIKLLQR